MRAQFQDGLVFTGYDQEAWVAAQRYQDAPWAALVNLWRAFNLHLAHVMTAVPIDVRRREHRAHNLNQIAWRPVPSGDPATLDYFMEDYVGHLKHHLRQILPTAALESVEPLERTGSRAAGKPMSFVDVQLKDGIATVCLERGKVNALNPLVVEQLSAMFDGLQSNPDVKAVVLTGRGKFFSFGFDLPEFLSYSREQFTRFLTSFTALYRALFVFPKPLVVALNGHAVAGGCMIALTCDKAILAQGSAKMSLNEIGFGSSVFAGSTEMLQFRAGTHAGEVLYSGAMYSPAEALAIGLVDEVVAPDSLLDRAREMAGELASRRPAAFAGIKSLLRQPVADSMAAREAASISDFVEIWYTEPTWTNLRRITIRS